MERMIVTYWERKEYRGLSTYFVNLASDALQRDLWSLELQVQAVFLQFCFNFFFLSPNFLLKLFPLGLTTAVLTNTSYILSLQIVVYALPSTRQPFF